MKQQRISTRFLMLLTVLLLVGVFPASPVLADSAGPGFPSVGANATGVGTVAWVDAGNIVSDDNLTATVTLNQNEISNYLQGTGFGFNLPSYATVTGIQVTVGRYSSKGGSPRIRDHYLGLLKGGALAGENKASTGTNWAPAEEVITYGADGDLWGTSWTPAEINQANFGVALAVANTNTDPRTAYLDYFQVTVFYTTPAAPEITALTLRQSFDTTTWTDVNGVLPSYRMGLNGDKDIDEYLDVKTISVNQTLKTGEHPFYLNTSTLPAGFYTYWDAKGVNGAAALDTWQGWMWKIINGAEPMFYLKVSAGPAYKLMDGLMWDFAASDVYLRVSGDYPLGTYTFQGTIEDTLGLTGTVTANITFEVLPALTALTLRQSLDTATWTDVYGVFSAYRMGLNGDKDVNEYLDVKTLTSNKALQEGKHPFYLDITTLPDGFYEYWDAKGVNDTSAPGSWQAWMWQIITGSKPMFYLQVGAGQTYQLVDGLMWDFAATPMYLQVSGDYPLGTYIFNGVIQDQIGETNSVTANITFEALPGITALTLKASNDRATWSNLAGDLAGGFSMELDLTQEFQFIDVAALTPNKALESDLHPFYLDPASVPATFYAYWTAKGVDPSAVVGTWQAWMWKIITGAEPMFYLKVSAGPTYKLVDGLTWDFGGVEDFLRVSGDYPLGSYQFTGTVRDLIYESGAVDANITFTRFNHAPTADAQSVSTEEDTPLAITLTASDLDKDSLTWHFTQPGKGVLSGTAPNLTYTPNANWNGGDSFTFYVNDGTVNSNIATISITVGAFNDQPTSSGIGGVTVDEDADNTSLDLWLSFADVEDADGSLLYVVTGNTNPSLFTSASISGNQNLVLDYAANAFGSADITIKATDTGGLFVETTFRVTVSPVNDAPVAVADGYVTANDQTLTVTAPTVLANDSDIDGGALSAVLVTTTTHGVLALNSNGTFSYTPNYHWSGADSFSYKAFDGSAYSQVVTVTITVQKVAWWVYAPLIGK